jgi:hypothetical protein
VGDHIEVTVYYEFFNPVGEKELLVGFEAESPYNSGRDPIALFPDHPHMRNFKVVVNGQPLHYEIAHVTEDPTTRTTSTLYLPITPMDSSRTGRRSSAETP